MSAQEIIAELQHLSRPELEQVDSKIHQLLQSNGEISAKNWGDSLLEIAGTAEGLPSDFAHNHDHYLHGAPRR